MSVEEKNKDLVLANINNILKHYGKIKDQRIKRYTIFSLLSYGNLAHNIKIEINIRKQNEKMRDHFTIKKYLGISMLVAKQEYLFTCKLAALTTRGEIAMRDVYDIYFFAKNNWSIDTETLYARTGKKTVQYLIECIDFIKKIKDNYVLQGFGELLDPKEKIWVKNNLKNDVIFMLKNYIAALSR